MKRHQFLLKQSLIAFTALIMMGVSLLLAIPASAQDSVLGSTVLPYNPAGQQIAQMPRPRMLTLIVPPVGVPQARAQQLQIPQVGVPQATTCLPGVTIPQLQYPVIAIIPMEQRTLSIYAMTDRVAFTTRVEGPILNVARIPIH